MVPMSDNYSYGRGRLDPRSHAACVEIAVRTGALKMCPNGEACLYRPRDDIAEIQVFAEASIDCVKGRLGGHSLEAIVNELYAILQQASIKRCACTRSQAGRQQLLHASVQPRS